MSSKKAYYHRCIPRRVEPEAREYEHNPGIGREHPVAASAVASGGGRWAERAARVYRHPRVLRAVPEDLFLVLLTEAQRRETVPMPPSEYFRRQGLCAVGGKLVKSPSWKLWGDAVVTLEAARHLGRRHSEWPGALFGSAVRSR